MRISKLKIDVLRANLGWKQADLAEHAGYSRQFIGVVLSRATCHPATAMRIANALGVGVEDILEGDHHA